MKLRLARAELLVEHLRDCIARGVLPDPLPSTRQWSAQLGVGRPTLLAALKQLRQEGLISVRSRQGVRLTSARGLRTEPPGSVPRFVRVLYYGRDYPDLTANLDFYRSAAEALQSHEIHLTVERCTHARLRAISERGERPHEMLVLASLSARHQKLFANRRKSALLLSQPAPGIKLSFVRFDTAATVRQATLALLGRGVRTIHLVLTQGGSAALRETADVFRATCAAHAPDPGEARVFRVPLELERLVLAAQRFAAQVRPGHGILIVRPVPLGTILGALLGSTLRRLDQAEIVAVVSSPDQARACPSLRHYPFPEARFIQIITRAARRYFESGSIPRLRQTLGGT